MCKVYRDNNQTPSGSNQSYFSRCTWMSNMHLTRRSSFPSSSWGHLRFLLRHLTPPLLHLTLLLPLDLETQIYHSHLLQHPILLTSHLPMDHIICTRPSQALVTNINNWILPSCQQADTPSFQKSTFMQVIAKDSVELKKEEHI